MKQKWKPMQFVEISMHEIFAFQDKLDAVKDDPEKVWDVVDDFFMECEGQLEVSPQLLKELSELTEDDFVPISVEKIDELFEDEDFSANYLTACDYVNYVLYLRDKPIKEKPQPDPRLEHVEIFGNDRYNKKMREDIPFIPRHDF